MGLAPETSERRRALAHCLEKLNERSRKLLKLRFEEELGAEEIAGHLSQSLAAVRKALTRARAFLVNCTGRALVKGSPS